MWPEVAEYTNCAAEINARQTIDNKNKSFLVDKNVFINTALRPIVFKELSIYCLITDIINIIIHNLS